MTGFILEIEADARIARQVQRDQVRIGGTVEVGFDLANRFAGPV